MGLTTPGGAANGGSISGDAAFGLVPAMGVLATDGGVVQLSLFMMPLLWATGAPHHVRGRHWMAQVRDWTTNELAFGPFVRSPGDFRHLLGSHHWTDPSHMRATMGRVTQGVMPMINKAIGTSQNDSQLAVAS